MASTTALLTMGLVGPSDPFNDEISPQLIKRCSSWNYLHRIFQGGRVYYNTALITEHDLRQHIPEKEIYKRSLRYFYLGYSLGTALDIPESGDYIKALNVITQDYENLAAAELKSKSLFFKGTTDEYTHLMVPNIPFNLDFIVTTSSLCDMIRQAYENILTLYRQDHSWPPGTFDQFQKVDARFKKIMIMLYKEIDSIARKIMREELNSIDPLGLFSSIAHDDDDW